MELLTQFTRSDAYRERVHQLIPGGAHTYSKGDDQFSAIAPAAISHGKGAWVWDPDGNRYLDCSMGLSSVSLGHAWQPVIDRVVQEISRGVNFQRPSVLELEMAELFLSLVPGHDMIKFAKNGSTVTTAAVKLARGFTGRKYVAFPAEHPFYSYDDWFIGRSACPRGVPEEFAALSLTYRADDIASLGELFDKYPGQIACVISEPEKQFPPPDGYVQAAIDLAQKHGALYILDEMVTGFKTDFPGSMKKMGVVPDMTTWGKGIANGFSFCCLTGKREVMELGGIRKTGEEKLFLISTTHGGETTGIAAGIATIQEFMRHDVVKHNHSIGALFMSKVNALLNSTGLSPHVELIGGNWLPAFVFRNAAGEVDAGMRTLMLQEMIRRGVLFQGIFIPCFSHNEAEIDWFCEAMADASATYKKALQEGWQKHLTGEPAKPVFRKFI